MYVGDAYRGTSLIRNRRPPNRTNIRPSCRVLGGRLCFMREVPL